MGVLPCSREGCSNIMCDRCSDEHGYICDDCFEELILLGIHQDINDFLGVEKKVDIFEARYYYNKIFKNRHDTMKDYSIFLERTR